MPISTPKKVGIGALALLGAFVLGYVPASLSAHAARAEQDRLTHKLALAALQVQLGMMSYEVNRDNYGLCPGGAGASSTPSPFTSRGRSPRCSRSRRNRRRYPCLLYTSDAA